MSMSVLMEGVGGLHYPRPGSSLKLKHCFSPSVQFCHTTCWPGTPASVSLRTAAKPQV